MTTEEGKKPIIATLLSRVGTWQDVRDAARNTVNKPPLGDAEVGRSFRRKILLAEHSPIRCLQFRIRLENLPYWVSVHLVRHKIGVDHYVTTQRDDRQNVTLDVKIDATKDLVMELIHRFVRKLLRKKEIPRKYKLQGEMVKHEMLINSQALINISRKRLCFLASLETTQAWMAVKRLMAKINEPEVASVMVPECVYRGFCPEMSRCKANYVCTPKFTRDLAAYRGIAS